MERARGEGKETRLMPSLPVKAGSWQQEMYAGTALSPEMGWGARSRLWRRPGPQGEGREEAESWGEAISAR